MTRVILHVEDDENDVFFFRKALSKAGVTVPLQVVPDGQQALDYLKGKGKYANRTQFPIPYLVLLDLKLPLVPGLDVLKFIREHQLTLIVIIFSSSESEEDIHAAYQLGVNAYLVKPSETPKLVDVAKGIKEFWFGLNRAHRSPIHAWSEGRP